MWLAQPLWPPRRNGQLLAWYAVQGCAVLDCRRAMCVGALFTVVARPQAIAQAQGVFWSVWQLAMFAARHPQLVNDMDSHVYAVGDHSAPLHDMSLANSCTAVLASWMNWIIESGGDTSNAHATSSERENTLPCALPHVNMHVSGAARTAMLGEVAAATPFDCVDQLAATSDSTQVQRLASQFAVASCTAAVLRALVSAPSWLRSLSSANAATVLRTIEVL